MKKHKHHKPKKRKYKIRLREWSKEELENFQFEIRKYLLAMGAEQRNGFRFEHKEKNPNGTVTLRRYDLLRRALTIHAETVNFNRKGRSGNLDPYRWVIETIGFYHSMTIKKQEKAEWNPQRQGYEYKVNYISMKFPNALRGES